MAEMKSWPPALLRRWLLQAASGLGCLAAGLVMFFAAGDTILLGISVILSAWLCLQCASFYRMVRKGGYEVVEGVCIAVKRIPFQKLRAASLRLDSGREISVAVDKRTAPEIGARYRAYCRQHASSLEQALAMERLPPDPPAIEK